MNRKRTSRTRRVQASKLAQMGVCEVRMVLDQKLGEKPTAVQIQARKDGDAEHARMDAASRRYHNLPPRQPRRGPCFIASQVYGYHDTRTDELRRFRDRVLRRSALGRWVIGVYYRHSPALAAWLSGRPWASALVRRGLDATRWLLRKGD